MFEGEQIKLIDFDDCGFGHFLYDFATSLAFQVLQPNFLELREGLFEGYESVRPLPPGTRENLAEFLRLRCYGLIRWAVERSDNPGMREHGKGFVESLFERIDFTYGEA